VVQRIYHGPATSRGEPLFLPYSLPGSELTWLDFFRGPNQAPRDIYGFVGEAFRYLAFDPDPGPAWKPEDFDFDRDPKRLGVMESRVEPVNPDLRGLKAAGAKLLAYTGWADPAEGVLRTVEYYENAEKIIGSRAATQSFFRLFVVPGMDHCRGGEGADAIDYLSALEAWVERGQAPEQLIGSHIRIDPALAAEEQRRRRRFPLDPVWVEFSRPVYPYPLRAQYLGHGDPRDASSFGPVEP
jgi:feruloyl esterase